MKIIKKKEKLFSLCCKRNTFINDTIHQLLSIHVACGRLELKLKVPTFESFTAVCSVEWKKNMEVNTENNPCRIFLIYFKTFNLNRKMHCTKKKLLQGHSCCQHLWNRLASWELAKSGREKVFLLDELLRVELSEKLYGFNFWCRVFLL